jgi:hypothetical protein
MTLLPAGQLGDPSSVLTELIAPLLLKVSSLQHLLRQKLRQPLKLYSSVTSGKSTIVYRLQFFPQEK